MKNIYLKLAFTVILTHCLAFIYACDGEDCKYPKIPTQKRKLNYQDDLRISKKAKFEATESSDLEKESENNDINSRFSLNYCKSVSPLPPAPITSEIENNIRASNLIKNGLVKISLGEHEAAILDYEQVLEMAEITHELKASAYINHGLVKICLGQYEAAILDYNHCLLLSEISNNIKIIAYKNRSYAKAVLGQTRDAILDIEEILKFKNFSSSKRLLSIYERLIALYEHQLQKKKIFLYNLNAEQNSNFFGSILKISQQNIF